MSVNANSLSVGNVIRYNNGNWKIVEKETVKPGKGGAFCQIALKHLTDGTKTKTRFRSDESVELVRTEEVQMQFLYHDGDNVALMNLANGDQINLPKSYLGNLAELLRQDIEESSSVMVIFADGQIISAKLPMSIIVQIYQTEPVIKHSTISPQSKPAFINPSKTISINIPSFIEDGALIKINTETMEYLSKA